MAELEQSGTLIPEMWTVIPTISLIVTFHLTKTKSRTKKCSYTIALSQGTIFVKKC